MRRKDDIDIGQDDPANFRSPDGSLPLLGRFKEMLPLPSHISFWRFSIYLEKKMERKREPKETNSLAMQEAIV